MVDQELHELFKRLQNSALDLRTESWKTRQRRLAVLESWLLNNRKRIWEALDLDLKKSREETDLCEVFPVITEIRMARKNLKRWVAPERIYTGAIPYIGTQSYIQYEPKGVCLIMAPWNYPLTLTLGPLVSALAAGNSVILKPSEYVPHTSRLIREMCEELYAPDIVSVVEGGIDESKALLELPFDHIFFTGSPGVGKVVMESASKHLTSVTLELGGKSPTIIDETINVRDVARKVVWGKWLNAGQTCLSPDYLIVHSKVKEALLLEIKKEVKRQYGNLEKFTSIVSQKHFSRLKAMISEFQGIDENECLAPYLDEENLRFGPAIYQNIPMEKQMMQEEIFGPILPIMEYENIDEVIDHVNSKPKALSLYIFSKRKSLQKKVIAETCSGTVVVNDSVLQFTNPSLPFGGTGLSGFGKSHGRYGFEAFSNQKAVLKQRSGFTIASLLFPPYTRLKNRLIEILLKYF